MESMKTPVIPTINGKPKYCGKCGVAKTYQGFQHPLVDGQWCRACHADHDAVLMKERNRLHRINRMRPRIKKKAEAKYKQVKANYARMAKAYKDKVAKEQKAGGADGGVTT